MDRRQFFAASAAGIAAGVLPGVSAPVARYPGPETQYIPAKEEVFVFSKADCERLREAVFQLMWNGRAIHGGRLYTITENAI